MCDYSLQQVKSRPAKVGDKLMTHNFGTGTRGFISPEKRDVAVCVLPGTELAFDAEVLQDHALGRMKLKYATAIFRQVNKGNAMCHHDTLEFPNGHTVLLTQLVEGQTATVLQLPAAPKTKKETEAQTRVAYV